MGGFDFVPEIIFKSNVQVYFTNKYKELVEGFLNPAKDGRALTQLIQDALLFAFDNLSEFEKHTGFNVANEIADNKKVADEKLKSLNAVYNSITELQALAKDAIVSQSDKAIYNVLYGLINIPLGSVELSNEKVATVVETQPKEVNSNDIREYIDKCIKEMVNKSIEEMKTQIDSMVKASIGQVEKVSFVPTSKVVEVKKEIIEEKAQDVEVKKVEDVTVEDSKSETDNSDEQIIDIDDDFGSGDLLGALNAMKI